MRKLPPGQEIASCHKLSDWQNNIYIEMGDNNRIDKLKKI
jgi:hypothetical protein